MGQSGACAADRIDLLRGRLQFALLPSAEELASGSVRCVKSNTAATAMENVHIDSKSSGKKGNTEVEGAGAEIEDPWEAR